MNFQQNRHQCNLPHLFLLAKRELQYHESVRYHDKVTSLYSLNKAQWNHYFTWLALFSQILAYWSIIFILHLSQYCRQWRSRWNSWHQQMSELCNESYEKFKIWIRFIRWPRKDGCSSVSIKVVSNKIMIGKLLPLAEYLTECIKNRNHLITNL